MYIGTLFCNLHRGANGLHLRQFHKKTDARKLPTIGCPRDGQTLFIPMTFLQQILTEMEPIGVFDHHHQIMIIIIKSLIGVAWIAGIINLSCQKHDRRVGNRRHVTWPLILCFCRGSIQSKRQRCFIDATFGHSLGQRASTRAGRGRSWWTRTEWI